MPQRAGADSYETSMQSTEGTRSWLVSSIPSSSTCPTSFPGQVSRLHCSSRAGGDRGCSKSHPGEESDPLLGWVHKELSWEHSSSSSRTTLPDHAPQPLEEQLLSQGDQMQPSTLFLKQTFL